MLLIILSIYNKITYICNFKMKNDLKVITKINNFFQILNNFRA